MIQESTGENILINGDFGSGDHWTELAVWDEPRVYDFNYAAGEFAGSDTGAALRVSANAGHNSMIYQAVQVEANQSYVLSDKFKDLGDGGNDMWAEIYLVEEPPQEWQDVTGRVLPNVDVNHSSLAEIKAFFGAFATMDYVVNPYVKESLTAEDGAKLFSDVPAKPDAFAIEVTDNLAALTWQAPAGNITEYQVYRALQANAEFVKIATTTETSFTDQIGDQVYFYYVVALSETDIGYPTNVIATGELVYNVPAFIEAENYSAAHPEVVIEETGDLGGGYNLGYFNSGFWVKYRLKIATTGNYTVDFRLASAVGDVSFEVLMDDELIETITVPNTGGWQTYETISIDLPLNAGQSVLTLNSIDDQWNINWIDIQGISSP